MHSTGTRLVTVVVDPACLQQACKRFTLTESCRFGYHKRESAMKNLLKNRPAFLLLITLFSAVFCAWADDSVNPVLRPPKCPQCRRVAPILEQASKTYKIPLVRHDFPLPMHNWSYQAAVMARYFDSISKGSGNDFRDY